MKKVALVGVTSLALAFAFSASASRATAPPVGPLPASQVLQQNVPSGTLFALALPATKRGTVWRVARSFDGHVAAELEERTLKSSTVIVLRALAPGKTSIVYALTKGDASPRALRAITLQLKVH
jgi:hypothetical protein